MIINNAIDLDSFAMIFTILVRTLVCKGSEKHVLSLLNPGIVVTGVYVYQDIRLRDGFSLL